MKDENPTAAAAPSTLWGRITVLWLVGTVILLPIKLINLPFNFEVVDSWVLFGLPVALLFFWVRPGQAIGALYLLPMWLVTVSSLLSSFGAPSATNSLMVIFKETYLFGWFFTVSMLLYKLTPGDRRVILSAWSIVATLHGLLIVAQFLSPELWRLTNALGNNTAALEGYRAAGLFICDKAGCANKAAYFQLMGFMPVLLAGFSKRTTIAMALTLLVSILTTGSMGTTLAFTTGLVVAGMAIAFFKRKLFLVLKYFLRLVFAALLLGAIFWVVTSLKPDYRDHFEKILVGRFDRSSEGRLNLWQRGIDTILGQDAFLWGVGPENFRVVDVAATDNQLHNDTLAFLVERGLIGVLGLALFAGIALQRATTLLQRAGKLPQPAHPELVVFLALIAATLVESLTHQMFRTRELWLFLAVQEALYFELQTAVYGGERPGAGWKAPAIFQRATPAQPGVTHHG